MKYLILVLLIVTGSILSSEIINFHAFILTVSIELENLQK